jgi:hypothetical protein
MTLQSLYEDLAEARLTEAIALRGLSRDEFGALKADMKRLGLPVTLRYRTSPKHVQGTFSLKVTKKGKKAWSQDLFFKLLNYLSTKGYYNRGVTLDDMKKNPELWSQDIKYHGLHFVHKLA